MSYSVHATSCHDLYPSVTLGENCDAAGSERSDVLDVGFLKRLKPQATKSSRVRRIRSAAPSCARNCTEHPGSKRPYAGDERRQDESRVAVGDPAAPSPDKPPFPLGAPVFIPKPQAVGFVVADHQGDHVDGMGRECPAQGDCVEVMIVDPATGRPAEFTTHIGFCSLEVRPIRNRPLKADLSEQPDDLTEIRRELEWLTTEMKFGTPAATDFARRLEIQNVLERWQMEGSSRPVPEGGSRRSSGDPSIRDNS